MPCTLPLGVSALGVQPQHPQRAALPPAVAGDGADGADGQAVVAPHEEREAALVQRRVDRVEDRAVPGHHLVEVAQSPGGRVAGVGRAGEVAGILDLQAVIAQRLGQARHAQGVGPHAGVGAPTRQTAGDARVMRPLSTSRPQREARPVKHGKARGLPQDVQDSPDRPPSRLKGAPMLAMNYRGPYRIRADHAKPQPRIEHPGDAIVRVSRACICGSDLHLYHGLVPDTRVGSTFGHEFTGTVAEVGSAVTTLKVGDRVTFPVAAVTSASGASSATATTPTRKRRQ